MGSQAAAEKVVVSTSMHQLLLDQSRDCDKEELTACKAITKECDSARASIADICKRLDHSLSRTANITFSSFVDSSAPRPLNKDEERCFVTVKSAVSDEMERRSCILDKVSGSRRFELAHKFVNGNRQRYALHASSDMHSVEWGMLQWLFTKEQLMGTFTYDRFHTVTNCRT